MKGGFLAGEKIAFGGRGYEAYELKMGNFCNLRYNASLKRLAFADGGQACVFQNPGQARFLIRAFAHAVHENRTVASERAEFYANIRAVEGISYEVQAEKVHGPVPEKIVVDSMDSRLVRGTDRADISVGAAIMRRVAEIECAHRMLEKLEIGDVIVLDGTLEARNEVEKGALDRLYSQAGKKKVLVCALSKSCSLLTNKGRPAAELLAGLGQGRWYYHPVCDIDSGLHQADVYFAKLHKKSAHAFRFEMYSGQALADPQRVLGFLAINSRDAMLPGYPYGLVKADRFARVSNREQEYLKCRHMEFGRGVHDVLDSA